MLNKSSADATAVADKKTISEVLKNGLNKVKGNLPTAVLVTAGIAGLTAGARGIASVYNKLVQDPKRKRILEELVREDPILRDADTEKLLEYYAVIYHIAPSITLNKGALREPLKNFVRFDKVDVATMKTLAELEDKITSNGIKGGPSGFISDMGNIAKLEQGALSFSKVSSDERELGSMAKLASSCYVHNKMKERYQKGIESINYFKSKGIF